MCIDGARRGSLFRIVNIRHTDAYSQCVTLRIARQKTIGCGSRRCNVESDKPRNKQFEEFLMHFAYTTRFGRLIILMLLFA